MRSNFLIYIISIIYMGIKEEVICSRPGWIIRASKLINYQGNAEEYWDKYGKARIMVICLTDKDHLLGLMLLRVLPKELSIDKKSAWIQASDWIAENDEIKDMLLQIAERISRKMRRKLVIKGGDIPEEWKLNCDFYKND